MFSKYACMLPGKDVEWALTYRHERIIRAKLEPIKMTVQKNCRLCFFRRLNLENALYHFGRLGEVSILKNFDGVYLSLGQLRDKPCAVLFIVRELDTFDSILRVLFPLELGYSLSCACIEHLQVHVSTLKLRVVLLAHNEELIGRRIGKVGNAWLSNLECFFAGSHVN